MYFQDDQDAILRNHSNGHKVGSEAKFAMCGFYFFAIFHFLEWQGAESILFFC